MSIVGAIFIFLVVWWVVLFTMLPIGVRNFYEEDADQVPGQADGAPVKPRLMFKFALTTVISAVIVGLIWASVDFDWVDWRQLIYDLADLEWS